VQHELNVSYAPSTQQDKKIKLAPGVTQSKQSNRKRVASEASKAEFYQFNARCLIAVEIE
jgi:hypothetical protein